jgi:tryptophan halogenase
MILRPAGRSSGRAFSIVNRHASGVNRAAEQEQAMEAVPVRTLVIVGGGTAGWMTAAALSKIANKCFEIHLIESDEIATIGVGEATIPAIQLFNKGLQLDENEFLKATQGTFKLGIQFVDWGQVGESYLHGFGPIGTDIGPIACHHYWLKHFLAGKTSSLGEYSINTLAALRGKYMRSRTDMPGSPLANIPNAFHFDAGLYARFLRKYAEARGVVRTEGRIVDVLKREDGGLSAVTLADGRQIAGDFFIDCSGIRALLIGGALGVQYEDWSHWLPCDRAIAVPCESTEPLLPYTRAKAHGAGWQWRIPLQNRIGNGHVYSSQALSEDEATSILMRNLEGRPLAEPRGIPFVPGRRRETWVKNCVAIGLSSGFFEPIESTNIHLIQTAIYRLISLFPPGGMDAADVREYNRQTQYEYERIRDFIVLHYKATRRTDTEFWRHCGAMVVPETLQHKIDLFTSAGRVFRELDELFAEPSWVQVMVGQGLVPRRYHPLVDAFSEADLTRYLDDVRAVIARCVERMPTHAQFVAEHCAAGVSQRA